MIKDIAEQVQKKHPWHISQERYVSLFKELPRKFLEERQAYDNMLEKSSKFELCSLILSSVKIEIKLTIDELIIYELSLDKWEEVRRHNIVIGDIKKEIKKKD